MDITSYLLGKQAGGGGGSSTLQDNKEVTITSNGTTEVNPDEGYDGLKKATITTNIATVPIASNVETVVGTWIDNRPLYMKTITKPLTTNSSGEIPSTNVSIGVTENLNTVFLGNNSYYMTPDLVSYPANYTYVSSGNAVSLIKTWVDTRNRRINLEAYSGILDADITVDGVFNVFYTKVGDSPLSDISSVEGLHYSTTEHIVGKMPNNDTIYEKTIQVTTSGYGNNNPVNKTVPHDIDNVEKIWLSDGGFYYSSNSSNRETYTLNFLNHNEQMYKQVVRTNEDATNVYIYVGEWQANPGTLYHTITLRYTKQTV